jgi:uncharacterized protein (TIGR02246 family)
MTDEDVIRTVIADWHRFSAAGDLQNVLRLMSEDVVFLTPGHPPIEGRVAFARLSEGMADRVRFESTYDIEEVRVVGSLAYTRTYLNVTSTPRDGAAPTHRSGRTLTIFEKPADGSWVVIRDANMLTVD